MATFPAKTNYAAGDILTAAQMVDIGNAINDLLPDAKGSLTTVSNATTTVNLPVGANNTYLIADSTETGGLKYTSSRWVTLASGSLSGTEVSLSGFSSAYNTLRLEIYEPQTATSSVDVSIRFNSNSGTLYEGCAISSLTTSVTNVASQTFIEPMFNGEPCPTGANTYSMFIEIDRYNDVARKFIKGMWNQTDNVWIGGHNFNATAAITSIQIRLNGTATFNGGTYVLRGI